jgi:PAS domain S-box-containing protein
MRKKKAIKVKSNNRKPDKEPSNDTRHPEHQQAFLLKFSDALRAENNPDAILNLALQMLFEHLKLDCCYIGIFHLEEDYGEFPHHVRTDKFPPLPKGVRLSDFPEALLKSFTGTLVMDDILKDKSLSDIDKQSFTALGYRGLAVATVRKGENIPLWSIIAVSGTPRHWLNAEIKLLEDATERTWAAVEKAKAEEKLRASEERFRAVQENSLDRFTILKPFYNDEGEIVDFTYVHQNYQAARTVGRRPEELIGRRMTEIFPTFPRTRFFEMYRQVVETKRELEFEDQYNSDGVDDWFRAKVTPVPDGIAIATQIITQSKKAEKALRESEERFKALSETAPVGIGVSSMEGMIVYTNPSYERILGYNSGEIIGMNSSDLYWKPAERESWLALMKEKGLVRDYEIRLKKKDGTPVWISINTSPIIFDGKPSVMGTIQDITHRKHLEDELRRNNEILEDRVRERTEDLGKLNETLVKSNKELENFAYIASHDLQEPLRMVTSFTQLLEKKYSDQLDQDGKEYISFAVDGAKRMYELLNSLLSYSRISRKEVKFSDVDLNTVLTEVKANLDLMIKDRKCLIESGVLPVVSADKSQMIQLFQNLISNGIKFSDTDPRISISVEEQESNYLFSVRDEGIGIEPQYYDKVFEIFKSASSKGSISWNRNWTGNLQEDSRKSQWQDLG